MFTISIVFILFIIFTRCGCCNISCNGLFTNYNVQTFSEQFPEQEGRNQRHSKPSCFQTLYCSVETQSLKIYLVFRLQSAKSVVWCRNSAHLWSCENLSPLICALVGSRTSAAYSSRPAPYPMTCGTS